MHFLRRQKTNCIFERTDEARKFEYGTQIDLGKSHLTDDKISPKGVVMVQVRILNFKNPSVNLEWVKLETSNILARLMPKSPYHKERLAECSLGFVSRMICDCQMIRSIASILHSWVIKARHFTSS